VDAEQRLAWERPIQPVAQEPVKRTDAERTDAENMKTVGTERRLELGRPHILD
jgi:hypothetical protein